jgi:hypothetical protein
MIFSTDFRDELLLDACKRYLESGYFDLYEIAKDPVAAFETISQICHCCMNNKKTFTFITSAYYFMLAQRGMDDAAVLQSFQLFLESPKIKRFLPSLRDHWFQLSNHLPIAMSFAEHEGRVPNDVSVLQKVYGIAQKISNCILEGAIGVVVLPGVDVHVDAWLRVLGIYPLYYGDQQGVATMYTVLKFNQDEMFLQNKTIGALSQLMNSEHRVVTAEAAMEYGKKRGNQKMMANVLELKRLLPDGQKIGTKKSNHWSNKYYHDLYGVTTRKRK